MCVCVCGVDKCACMLLQMKMHERSQKTIVYWKYVDLSIVYYFKDQ